MEYFLVLDLKGGISSVNLFLKSQQDCNFTICAVIQDGKSLWYIL